MYLQSHICWLHCPSPKKKKKTKKKTQIGEQEYLWTQEFSFFVDTEFQNQAIRTSYTA